MFVVERLVNLIAPHECLVCQTEGSLLCEWCQPDYLGLIPECCYRCKRLSTDYRVCKNCRSVSPLKHVWVATEYAGTIKTLIRSFKFDRAQAAAVPIAKMLANSLPYLDRDTLITHIPTATSRRRQRGYDHAALLAKELAGQTGLHFFSLLARVGQSRQVGATREQRLKQLETAFRPANPNLITGAQILLVDDIVTTGGTISAAAKVLKANGAKSVSAAIFAQKL